MLTQATRHRRTWLIVPVVHATAFVIQWLAWQIMLVEPRPILAPIGYIIGLAVALGALVSIIPAIFAIILMFTGFAPGALTAALVGIASGTISHVLFRFWLPLGLPDTDGLSVLFIQNGLALALVVAVCLLREVRS